MNSINNINTKKHSLLNMKRYFILIMVLVTMVFSSYAQEDQNVLLYWDFEEGNGDIVYDRSGFMNNGFMFGGTTFSGNSVFGDFSALMQGSNDYIDSLTSAPQPEVLTVSFWAYTDSFTSNDYWMEFDGSTGQFEIEYTNSNTAINLGYLTDTDVETLQILDDSGISLDTWEHYIVSVNANDDTVSFWRNGVNVVDDLAITGGYQLTPENKRLRIGANHLLQDDWDGQIDDLRIMDFKVNDTQVQELYLTNSITLFKNPITDPTNQTIATDIFEVVTPLEGANFSNPAIFEMNLNREAQCDLYIDSQLEEKFIESVAFTYQKQLTIGEHEYFIYCSYIEGETEFFEITNVTSFTINPNEATVATFNIVGTDFDVNGVDLWVTSPCLEEGFSAIGTEYGKYRPQYNPNGAYFSPVVNGVATINVSSGINEFCLHNGRIIVNGEGKTTNYDVVNALGVVELGDVDIPRENAIFTVNIDQFQIYEVYDPKAYGKTWSGLMGGFILVLFGGLICLAGVRSNNGKIVVAGALIFMAGFGIGVNGLLGILV